MYLGTAYLAIGARTCLLLDLHTVIEVLLSKRASVLACGREHSQCQDTVRTQATLPVSCDSHRRHRASHPDVAVFTARIERTPDVAGQRGPRG